MRAQDRYRVRAATPRVAMARQATFVRVARADRQRARHVPEDRVARQAEVFALEVRVARQRAVVRAAALPRRSRRARQDRARQARVADNLFSIQQ